MYRAIEVVSAVVLMLIVLGKVLAMRKKSPDSGRDTVNAHKGNFRAAYEAGRQAYRKKSGANTP
jgi:hypothetical protein